MASLALPYCGPAGESPGADAVWVDDGFSPCLVKTVSASVAFGFIFFVGGTLSFLVRRSQGDRRSALQARAQGVQVALAVACAALCVAQLVAVSVIRNRVLEVDVVYGVFYAGAWVGAALQLSGRRGKRAPGAGAVGVLYAWEVVRIAVSAASYRSPHWFLSHPDSTRHRAYELAFFAAVAAAVVASAALEVCVRVPGLNRRGSRRWDGDDGGEDVIGAINAEREPLIRGGHGHGHGGFAGGGGGSVGGSGGAAKGFGGHGHGHGGGGGGPTVKQRTGSTFTGFGHKVKLLWPYLWPSGYPSLQLRIVVCVVILVSIRVVNLLVPLWYKRIIDALDSQANGNALASWVGLGGSSGIGSSGGSNGNGWDPTSHNASAGGKDWFGGEGAWADGAGAARVNPSFPWQDILVYVCLRYLQGGGIGSMGLLSNLRSFLWIDVQQYTSRGIRNRLFTHFHDQDLKWHLNRKTGEVLRMMERGSDSINQLLSYVIFNILPTLADIGIAVAYFTATFGVYYGMIVFATMGSYIWITISVTEWRTQFRREMNTRDNAIRQKATDSLLNAETVKLYSGEKFEARMFLDKILDFQKHEWRSLASLALLNVAQSTVIAVGLMAGAMLCGYEVSQGERTVGDFVLFITYVAQLYAPLNWFGTYFRMIQAAFVDMENMIDLFEIRPTVVDRPGALPLVPSGDACGIEFDNVSFGYEPARPILKGVTFAVPPGTTCAIVGSTGSGKSTLMRLLFRFYDVDGGSIRIDGQSIADCKLDSVRGIMGVVPQDTVLFHDTIRYNIRYGRMDAGDAEVVEAAEGAEILQAIKNFPAGFETVVGERGLKLSGGEKQRVAIARTILKRPLVVMLDEATSALDTETERAIQASLDRVCRNRTSIVIAHRLSTVVNADEIVVLRDGQVAERGQHADLLARRGAYYDMWQAQAQAADGATEEDGEGTGGEGGADGVGATASRA